MRVSILLLASMALGSAAAAQFPYTLDFHFAPGIGHCQDGLAEDYILSCDYLDPSFNDFGGQHSIVWVIVGGVPDGTTFGESGGVGGLQFGIEYSEGTVVSSWTLCSGGSQIPQQNEGGTWPSSGTGNAVTFSGGCKTVTANEDGLTKVGYFTIQPRSSPGVIRFTEDPRIGMALAADCAATPIRICRESLGVGDLTVGGSGGTNVCGTLCAVPVREATWGSIKAAYSE
jgi:hypothetical protein